MAESGSGLWALAWAVVLAVGCADPPAEPTPPEPEPEPVPSTVSVEIGQTTARVDEIITITYRLAPALNRSGDVWTEVAPPFGETRENGPIDFPAGQATHVFNTRYIPDSWIGTWRTRIEGERPGRRRARPAVPWHVDRRPVTSAAGW